VRIGQADGEIIAVHVLAVFWIVTRAEEEW
jgi:hypothetical protein